MGDLISRADAIAYIDRIINSGLGRNKSLDYIHKYISALPSADAVHIEAYRELYEKYVELKHASAETIQGEWVIRDDMPKLDNTYSIECSECGQLMFGHYNADNPNFCCNCGARMTPYKGGDKE